MSNPNTEIPSIDSLTIIQREKMAVENPELLQKILENEQNKIISKAPEERQRKLEGLLFKLDAQRKMSTNHTSAYIKIYRLMHESFGIMDDYLNNGIPYEVLNKKQTGDSHNITPFRKKD